MKESSHLRILGGRGGFILDVELMSNSQTYSYREVIVLVIYYLLVMTQELIEYF